MNFERPEEIGSSVMETPGMGREAAGERRLELDGRSGLEWTLDVKS